jgi:hypothetical protein
MPAPEKENWTEMLVMGRESEKAGREREREVERQFLSAS